MTGQRQRSDYFRHIMPISARIWQSLGLNENDTRRWLVLREMLLLHLAAKNPAVKIFSIAQVVTKPLSEPCLRYLT